MRLAVLALLPLTAAAVAAAPANFKLSNPDAPIAYAAQHCEAAMKEGELVCTGNVVISQGEVRLHADRVRIHAVDGKADTVYADGHVVINSPSGTATGDTGLYRVVPRRITLTGHVVLVRERNVLRGPQLDVDLITGKAKLTGGVKDGGPVQGLFTPQTAPNGKD